MFFLPFHFSSSIVLPIFYFPSFHFSHFFLQVIFCIFLFYFHFYVSLSFHMNICRQEWRLAHGTHSLPAFQSRHSPPCLHSGLLYQTSLATGTKGKETEQEIIFHLYNHLPQQCQRLGLFFCATRGPELYKREIFFLTMNKGLACSMRYHMYRKAEISVASSTDMATSPGILYWNTQGTAAS